MRRLLLPLLLALPFAAIAQTAPVASAPGAALETAIVRAPGPGFWKVTRGDHTLWVLGTVSPLPADMAWNSAPLRSKVGAADSVLHEPSIAVGADVGFFGKLALLPSLVGIRDLPEGQHLVDVLPPATYARWTRLKARYIGRDGDVEEWRPIFAAMKLHEAALKSRGLSERSVVSAALGEAMKARGLKATTPTAKVTITNPRSVLKEFKGTQLADVRCFERMLDRVENDLDTLSARADAWAAGDIAGLRRLQASDPADACQNAVMSGAFAEKYGLDRLEAQARAKWLAEVDARMARDRTIVAVLPMREVLAADGLLATLQARGYTVEAPQEGG